MKRAWRRALLSWGLVVLLSLVLLEIVLRLSALWPAGSAVFVSDPEVGYRMRPGLEVPGGVTSSRGFNDRERAAAAPGGPRLAFVGDSFVFGVVARDQNFVSRFQELAGDELEVLNLGIPAAGPHTYLELLTHDVVELGADTAGLVLFVGNDVAQAHPDFRTRVWFGAPREVLRRPYLLRLSSDYLYLWRLARAGSRTFRQRFDPPSEGTFSERAYLAIEAQRAEVCKKRLSPQMEESYRGLEALLAEMAAAARRHGVELFAVLAPDHFQVDGALRQALAAERGLILDDYDLDKPQQLLTAMLDRLGVPVLDLLPAFRGHPAAMPLYLPRDSHWNAAGNRLAAEEIYAFYEELLGSGSPAAAAGPL